VNAQRIAWSSGGIVAASISGYLTWAIAQPSPRVFLPGRTSDGHHQIEDACASCHTPLGGVEQAACLRCHGAELEEAHDSHPPAKFTDPRNAERTAVLDAARCVTCHREHRPEMTRPMAVTLQDDFCFHCHAEVGRERPTHAGLAFDTCADGACHNFHDNRALYLDFLVRGAADPRTLSAGRVPLRPRRAPDPTRPVSAADVPKAHRDPDIERAWAASAHGAAAVGCDACHDATRTGDAPNALAATSWNARPGLDACSRCHANERAGFLAGKHGMRVAARLSPMRPALARAPMKAEAAHRELGCGSCHEAHGLDILQAAVESCEGCHDDAHTRAYRQSAHFRLWQRERREPEAFAGTGVSCATCHLPRKEVGDRVRVEHNQNANLRPNEKMAREVCLRCHGLPFSLDALADAALAQRNFSGAPARVSESFRMALARQAERGASKQETKRSD
jgi:predicted CXXCH cytochrome family protein